MKLKACKDKPKRGYEEIQTCDAKLLPGLFPAAGNQVAHPEPDPPITSSSPQAVVSCLSVSISSVQAWPVSSGSCLEGTQHLW